MAEFGFHTVRGYQLLQEHQKTLTSALEDYLEMIYREIRREGYVRIATLADKLHVTPPSVTKMAQKLGALGFVEYQKYGILRLTEKGEELGEYLLWRHDTVARFFRLALGEGEGAFIEAELAEHALGQESVEFLGKIATFFEQNPEIWRRFTGGK